jgi:hypothetical protein
MIIIMFRSYIKTRKYDNEDKGESRTGTTYCTDNAWEGSKENNEVSEGWFKEC